MTESPVPTDGDDYDAAWDEATQASGEISREIIDEIRNRIDLAALIGETCTLDGESTTRFDHGHKHQSVSGNCLSVYTNTHGMSVWKCFSCADDGAEVSGGDCLSWIADRDNLDMQDDFPEIVRIAAEYAGVTLPTSVQDRATQRTFECLTAAARIYHSNLTDEMYGDIESKWGISRETCDQMLIGSVKTDGSEKEALRGQGFTFDEMLSTGLFSGVINAHAFFKGRYTFPYWERGQIKYMIARRTKRTPEGKYDQGKYKKLRTNKGEKKNEYISPSIKNIIFGTDSLRNTDYDYCIITEGVTDAIMVMQGGLPCVSPVTVGFNQNDHDQIIKLVRRFKRVYICMDNETTKRGEKGAYKTARHLFNNDIDAYVVELPREKGEDKIDLADYLRDYGIEAFKRLLPLAIPASTISALEVPADTFLAGDKKVFDANMFAKWLITDSGFSFVTFADTKEILQYTDGIYQRGAETTIEATVEYVMDGFKVTKNAIAEIIGHIQRRTYMERNEFDTDKDIINLENGLYNIVTGEFSQHDPAYLSLHKSPIIYDPDATCPRIDLFFKEVLLSKNIPFFYELFGYALLPKKRLDTAVLFEGRGANGKSRMIGLLDTFVGSESVSHVTPIELGGDDKYSSADLFGKLINTIDDLGDTPLKDLGVFKSVVSGQEMRGQAKFKPAFKFTPNALCVFGCNDVPITADTSDGFFRRMVTIPFMRKFDGDDKDPDLHEKLTAPTELSGLFNQAMSAVREVIDRKGFTNVGTIEDKRRAYLYASNPVVQFVDDLCDITDPDKYIAKDELYNKYVTWSRDNNIRVKEKKYMTIYLGEIGCMTSRPTGDDGERYQAYLGIDLNNE